MIMTDAAKLVESEVNEDGYGIFISKFEIIFLSVPVKKEEDTGLYIKEENLRDGHCQETRSEMDRERERGMKENSEKKGSRETGRDDHSMGDSSKEVRISEYLPHSFITPSSTKA